MTVHRMPLETEEALERHPSIADQLDEKALGWLSRCSPDRAAEILEEVAEKDDVRNPSAFVSIAASKYPRKRGRQWDPDEALSKYPHIVEQLDDIAVAKLREADPERAAEILEDMDAKSDIRNIRNPSAFVAKALNNFPHKRGAQGAHGGGLKSPPAVSEVDEALQSIPDSVASQLDEVAVLKLREVDPARAVEILGDLASKDDVRNPSAFVVKALKTYPQERGHADSLERILAQHKELARSLDDRALQMLQDADPARAVEIVEDLVVKGDVRNPSAFISSALSKFPHKRGGFAAPPVVPTQKATAPRASPSSIFPIPSRSRLPNADPMVEQALRKHHTITGAMDEVALSRLREANPLRAVEIIDDLALSGTVRNPSAFVVKALNDFPHPRGAESDLNKVLSRHSNITSKLDEVAMARLREADPERAVEIIKDVAAKGDVRNPSGFVCTALNKFPHKRGPSLAEHAGPPSFAFGGQHTQSSIASHVRSIFGAALGHPLAAQSTRASSVDDLLRRIPAASRLDEVARSRLREVDSERAAEILEDLDGKADVRNPSAFVVRAIADHPYRRGRADEPRSAGGMPSSIDSLANRLSVHPRPSKRHRHEGVRASLDDVAKAKLDSADPARASEVLEELRMKGSEVRNASAFVCKALQQFPFPRGRSSGR